METRSLDEFTLLLHLQNWGTNNLLLQIYDSGRMYNLNYNLYNLTILVLQVVLQVLQANLQFVSYTTWLLYISSGTMEQRPS